MLHLWRNQVADLPWQNVWKTPLKSDILSKDADILPVSLLKISLLHRRLSQIFLVQISYFIFS